MTWIQTERSQIKVELSNGVESRQPVWEGHGSPENFLCHMQGMREALEDMGLFRKYEEARQKVSRAKEQVREQKDLREVVLEQIENTVLESDKEPLREEAAKHSKAIKEFKAAVAAAKQEQVAAMATIFSTTASFFRGDGNTPWDNIVHEQTQKDPWTNLRGEEQSGIHGKTMAAWNDCYTLMLKTVFTNNAAERQKFYLTLLRLNPSKMKVRPFLQRFTMLASYVGELPSLIHSRDGTDATMPVEPYGDGELATIGLHAMPNNWRTQYDLVHKAPRDVQYLQDALEKIKVAFPLGRGNGSFKNIGKGNKMTTMADKIPKKKSHVARHERLSAKSWLCARGMGARTRLTTRMTARSTITRAT
jgi:hypothetical protein